MQLSYFQSTVIELNAILGESQATTLLHNSLFMIEHGSNDYLYNYLMPNSSSAALYTPAQFHKYLVSVYKTQLTVCSVNLVSLSLLPQEIFYVKRGRLRHRNCFRSNRWPPNLDKKTWNKKKNT